MFPTKADAPLVAEHVGYPFPMKVCVQWASSGSPRPSLLPWSEQEHAPASICQPDQQAEGNKNPE